MTYLIYLHMHPYAPVCLHVSPYASPTHPNTNNQNTFSPKTKGEQSTKSQQMYCDTKIKPVRIQPK